MFKVSEKAPVRKYYKVVSKESNGSLRSVFTVGKARVEYKIGEWVQAPRWLARKGYHLFVYDSPHVALYNAIGFYESGAFMFGVVYMCDVQHVYSQLPNFLNDESLWNGKVEPLPYEGFPGGTVMVQRVKLLEEVKDFKQDDECRKIIGEGK